MAESSFGRGLPRDDRAIYAAGRNMKMRIVTVSGNTFAVFQETGNMIGARANRSILPQLHQTAQANTGCTATGNGWMQQFNNGAHPRFSIHLAC